jgi:hypothetical protein
MAFYNGISTIVSEIANNSLACIKQCCCSTFFLYKYILCCVCTFLTSVVGTSSFYCVYRIGVGQLLRPNWIGFRGVTLEWFRSNSQELLSKSDNLLRSQLSFLLCSGVGVASTIRSTMLRSGMARPLHIPGLFWILNNQWSGHGIYLWNGKDVPKSI